MHGPLRALKASGYLTGFLRYISLVDCHLQVCLVVIFWKFFYELLLEV